MGDLAMANAGSNSFAPLDVGKVLAYRREVFSLGFEPIDCIFEDFLLLLKCYMAHENFSSQEYEIGIDGIAGAVVVDFLKFARLVHGVDIMPGDAHFSGQPQPACQQV